MTRTALGWSAFVLVAGVAAGCMSGDAADSGLSPQDPPLPSVPSILPLQIGNEWHFHDAIRDSSGDVTQTRTLTLRIPFAYGLRPDSGLDRISWESNAYGPYIEYWFAYEWDYSGKGYLVTSRADTSGAHGVYIVGMFDQLGPRAFGSAQLWLADPAVAASQWQYTVESDTVRMALIARDTALDVLGAIRGSHVPVTLLDCALYRQTDTDGESYYYYHRDYGPLGYHRYSGGRLVRSYIATSVSVRL